MELVSYFFAFLKFELENVTILIILLFEKNKIGKTTLMSLLVGMEID